MSGEAQCGTNMARMILGIVLIAAGNLLAISLYPRVPEVVLPAHPGVMGMGVVDMGGTISNYFHMLLISLLMVNIGAIFLYLSRDCKQA